MESGSKETLKMKVFQKGQVVIPVSLRKKYLIEIGDLIDVIPSPEGILLKPHLKETGRKSLTDRLFGLFNEYASEKTTKSNIQKATENGFTQGCEK
jgi:bifunctional DNA-binding transcriptional regulator/antitoxin component of YhaV-PrlF toxin-antitoxin module